MHRSRAMPSRTALTRELLIIIHHSNYSTWKNVHVFNFRRLGVSTKIFNNENFPLYGMIYIFYLPNSYIILQISIWIDYIIILLII